jgi:hypothetical protein
MGLNSILSKSMVRLIFLGKCQSVIYEAESCIECTLCTRQKLFVGPSHHISSSTCVHKLLSAKAIIVYEFPGKEGWLSS